MAFLRFIEKRQERRYGVKTGETLDAPWGEGRQVGVQACLALPSQVKSHDGCSGGCEHTPKLHLELDTPCHFERSEKSWKDCSVAYAPSE